MSNATISQNSSGTNYPPVSLSDRARWRAELGIPQGEHQFPLGQATPPRSSERRPWVPLIAARPGAGTGPAMLPPSACTAVHAQRRHGRGRCDFGACAHSSAGLRSRCRRVRPLPAPPAALPVLGRCRALRGGRELRKLRPRGDLPRHVVGVAAVPCPGQAGPATPDRVVAKGPAGRTPWQASLPSSLVASRRGWSGEAGAVRRGAVSALRRPARAGSWSESSGGPCSRRDPGVTSGCAGRERRAGGFMCREWGRAGRQRRLAGPTRASW